MIGLVLALSTLTSVEASSPAAVETNLLALAETEYRIGLEMRGDAARARPHFERAAVAYEELWQQGQRNLALARNMAQAHFLAGDLARAIRAYHLGMRMAAHDPDLRAGLAFARDQVRFPVNGNLAKEAAYHDRRTFLHHGPAWLFGALAAGVYLIAALLIARGWMSRRPLWWGLGGFLAVISIMMAGAVLWEDKHLADENALPIVIVLGDGAPLHRGNGREFPLRIAETLPEGTEMIVLIERGGWYQVRLGGGAIGWVEASRVIAVDQTK